MKKIISIILGLLCLCFCISCNEKINIEDTNIVNDLKTKIQLVCDKYYLKHNDKNFKTEDVKEDLYICVASGFKTCYNVSFGSVNFDNKEKLKFNIGNNSFIYADAFFKQKNSLFVFAPLLALEGGNSKTLLFCVDGLYFSVKVYDGEYDNLSFVSAVSMSNETQNVKNEKNKADRDVVTHQINDMKDELGINLSLNNLQLNNNSIFFVRKSYQKYSEPTEYLMYIKNQNDTDVIIKHNDMIKELKYDEKCYIDIAITLFGGGEIGFDLWLEYKN